MLDGRGAETQNARRIVKEDAKQWRAIEELAKEETDWASWHRATATLKCLQ